MSYSRYSVPKEQKSSSRRPGDQLNPEASLDRQYGVSTRSMSLAASSERTTSQTPQWSLNFMPTEDSPGLNTQQYVVPDRSSWTSTSTSMENTRWMDKYHHRSNEDTSQAKIQTLERQLSERNENIKRLQDDLRKKDEETKVLSTRLSEMASKNVSSSNAGLEDLSTQNRSMKIAEEFEQDLYGSVWFLALESLLEINDHVGEDGCTRLLVRILMVVYKKYKDQLQTVIVSGNTFLSPGSEPKPTFSQSTDSSVSTNTDKFEREIKRLFASNMSLDSTEFIKTRYIENILTEAMKSPELRGKDWSLLNLLFCLPVKNFVEVSSKICRMMLVQDPPMVLISEANKDDLFNPLLFACYGRKGQRVDFLVWPALLLYDGGPVINKGMVKCK